MVGDAADRIPDQTSAPCRWYTTFPRTSAVAPKFLHDGGRIARTRADGS